MNSPASETEPTPARDAAPGPLWVRIAVLIAILLALGLAVALVVHHSRAKATPNAAAPSAIGPLIATPATLRALSSTMQQPIYWAGPQQGYSYELTRSRKGYVYVRYLPPGVKAKDPRSSFLVVATYPFRNGYDALKKVAHGKGLTLDDGTLVLPGDTSVYLAKPDAAYQIEVYSPDVAQARDLALSGRVRPVGP